MDRKGAPEWESFMFILTSPQHHPVFIKERSGFILASCIAFSSLMSWLNVQMKNLRVTLSGDERHESLSMCRHRVM